MVEPKKKNLRNSLGVALLWFGSASNIAFFVACLVLVGSLVRSLGIPFDTDEADHATASLELFMAAMHGSVGDVFGAVQRQAFYPPVHSFMVAASYALMGMSLASSRMPSVLCSFGAGVFLMLGVLNCTRNLRPPVRYFCATLPLLLSVSNTIIIENSALSMLEMPGVLLTCLLLWFLSTQDQLKTQGIVMASLIGMSISLTKYSFGILVIPGLVAALMWPRPKQGVMAGLIVIAAIGVWATVTDQDSFVHFFVGHPSYAPLLSRENLLFEIRAWFAEYSPSPLIGGISLALAFVGSARIVSSVAARAAFFITGASFSVLMLSTTNESRHFIVAAPCVWFLGALGAASVATTRTIWIRPLAVGALVVTYAACFGSYDRIRPTVMKGMEGKPAFGELQQKLFEVTDPRRPLLIVGASDQFSQESLRWYAARAASMRYTQVAVDAYPYRDDKNFTALKRQRNLDRPYRDPSAPHEPVQAVLDSGYYDAVALIRRVGVRNPTSQLIKEIKDRYGERTSFVQTIDDSELTVISLK